MPIIKSRAVRTTVQKSLAYILNPDKTEDLLYTASLNCMTNPTDAYLNMKMVYEQYSGRPFDEPLPEKGKGRVKAIHYIQSFSPDENISPKQAHRIAKAFVRKTFGDDCKAVIATHVDKHHVHSHIILNSYSLTGQKFYDNKTTRNHVREYSDCVCLAFGIQPLKAKSSKAKNSSYAEWSNKCKGTSWKEQIKLEIDVLIPQVKNVDELMCELERLGYTVNRRKHISVRAPKQKRAVRLETLGDVYSLESLDIRIHYADENCANRGACSELQVAYEFVIGEVMQLAQSGQKVQRRRNSALPYSTQNDLDIYKLSAQLTIINRDHLHSIDEITDKMGALQQQYENARLEMNRLTEQLEKLNSLAEQAEHYFSLINKDDDLSETDKLLLSMEHETLERNNICSHDDYAKLDALRKSVQSQVSALKAEFQQTKHHYDVYSDIAETYETIAKGDYISKLVEEKRKEVELKKTITKKNSR